MTSMPPPHEPTPCPGCERPHSEARCSWCGAARAPGGLLVQRVISQTPHGRLYAALDAQGLPVAVKELVFAHAPGVQWLEAFEREARLLQSLAHPRIPRFQGAFHEGEGVEMRLYLVQELVPGESLEEHLFHHRFDEDEARDIARQVLEVLAYLHGCTPPVVHRDVKPANLLRREDGSLVLVDFGSARVLAEGNANAATITGTFGYMAPEQLAGSASPRSDLYGLGATLLHLLSRQPPEALLRGDYAVVFGREVNVSPPFAAFLRRLVARRPEDRFPDANAALAALDGRVSESRSRRKRWALAAAGTLGVTALLAVAWSTLGPAAQDRGDELVARAPAAPAPLPPPAVAPAPPPAPAPAVPPAVTGPVPRASWSFDGEPKEKQSAADTPGAPPLKFYHATSRQGLRNRGMSLEEQDRLHFDSMGFPKEFQLGNSGAVSFWVGRSSPGPGPLFTLSRGNDQALVQLRMGWQGELRLGHVERWMELPEKLSPDRYHHMVLAWRPEGYRFWLDGRRVVETVPVPGREGRPARFNFGIDPSLQYIPNPALSVDDVRLFEGVLEDKDVQALVEAVPERTSQVPPESVPRTQWASRPQPVTELIIEGSTDFQVRGKPRACAGGLKLEMVKAAYTLVPAPAERPSEDGSERESLVTLTFDAWVGSRQPRGACAPDFEAHLRARDKEGTEYAVQWLRPDGDDDRPKLQLRMPLARRRGMLVLGSPQAPFAWFEVDLDERRVWRLVQVEGRVVEARSGIALEGVEVGGRAGRSEQVLTKTDAEGRFRFLTGAGEGYVLVIAPNRKRLDKPIRVDSRPSFQLGELRIEEPALEPGKIGVWLKPADEGVLLYDVFRSGPAWKAGVRPGDIAVAANGHPVRTVAEAVEHFQGQPGSQVKLTLRRGKTQRMLRVQRAR